MFLSPKQTNTSTSTPERNPPVEFHQGISSAAPRWSSFLTLLLLICNGQIDKFLCDAISYSQAKPSKCQKSPLQNYGLMIIKRHCKTLCTRFPLSIVDLHFPSFRSQEYFQNVPITVLEVPYRKVLYTIQISPYDFRINFTHGTPIIPHDFRINFTEDMQIPHHFY